MTRTDRTSRNNLSYPASRRGAVIDLREVHLVEQRHSLEQELGGAMGRGELRVEHQPIVSTVDRRITGVEALLRWEHPSRGILAPAEVIPLAEESGLITEIGQ